MREQKKIRFTGRQTDKTSSEGGIGLCLEQPFPTWGPWECHQGSVGKSQCDFFFFFFVTQSLSGKQAKGRTRSLAHAQWTDKSPYKAGESSHRNVYIIFKSFIHFPLTDTWLNTFWKSYALPMLIVMLLTKCNIYLKLNSMAIAHNKLRVREIAWKSSPILGVLSWLRNAFNQLKVSVLTELRIYIYRTGFIHFYQ